MSVLGEPETLRPVPTPEAKAYADGVVRKDALRHYWTTALKMLPDLRFDVVGVYRDADGLVRWRHGTFLD
jgi:hypothetical protein